jgi:hypothetical protein
MYEMTRREALRNGGIAAGGLAVGGVAVSGTVTADHGRSGGVVLLLSEPLLGVPFTATETFEFAFPASCFASESALKGFREFAVEYANTDGALAAVRTDRNHLDLTGGTEYVFTSAQQCREPATPAAVWQASFRPA